MDKVATEGREKKKKLKIIEKPDDYDETPKIRWCISIQ
jgi:hypothetical protein